MFFAIAKEYKSCKNLEYGIHFDVNGLFYCAYYFHSKQNNVPVSLLCDNLELSLNSFLKQREKDRKLAKKGIIPNRCDGCFFLESKKWDSSKKIKSIIISANRKCNANCLYCVTHKKKNIYNEMSDLPIYDFLEKIINKGLVDNNCFFEFGGGEPTLHFEFEKIMNLISSKLNPQINIYSSAIKYSPVIQTAIKNRNCQVVVSLDSGNSELYKKIKNVDEFNNVISTISKYCAAQNEVGENKFIILKYLIIPSLNDSKEQILEFLTVAKNVNCKEIRCDIESNWYNTNKDLSVNVIPILQLMNYMEKEAKKMEFSFYFNSMPYSLIEKYSSEFYSIH